MCDRSCLGQIDKTKMMKIFMKPKVMAAAVASGLVVLYLTASQMHARLAQQGTDLNADGTGESDSVLDKDKGASLDEMEKLLSQGQEISDSDLKLAELVRFRYIDSPVPDAAYHLDKPNQKDYSRGQSPFINEVLAHKKGGFFVDIGAGDGESESISLYFEKEMDWTGLLIEPNPQAGKRLQAKNRRSPRLRGCVNPSRSASLKKFQGSEMADGKLLEQGSFSAICFSFYTIVTALGRRQIDLLTVDVHGKELAILKSIPFDLIEVNIVSVEHGLGVADDIIRLMESQGYRAINVMENQVTNKRDVLFQRNRSNRH